MPMMAWHIYDICCNLTTLKQCGLPRFSDKGLMGIAGRSKPLGTLLTTVHNQEHKQARLQKGLRHLKVVDEVDGVGAQGPHVCGVTSALQQEQVIKSLAPCTHSPTINPGTWTHSPGIRQTVNGYTTTFRGPLHKNSIVMASRGAGITSKMSMEGWWMVQTTVRPVFTVLRTVRMTMAAARASRPAQAPSTQALLAQAIQ